MRWMIEKITGLAQGVNSRRWLASVSHGYENRLTKPSREPYGKVLYFVDIFANWFDPDLARCLVSVLKHHGVSVYVPTEQHWSTSSAITESIEYARELAQRNVSLLSDAVRQGYTIVTTEPTAAMCPTQEYPNLLGDDESRLVAENTQDAHTTCGDYMNLENWNSIFNQ